MRVLLDECVPRKLRRELPDHEVQTVVEMGWAGVKNGPLLRRAAEQFDVFLTADQGIRYQQNLAGVNIAVIIMCSRSLNTDDLLPLLPRVREALGTVSKGDVVRVES